MCGRFSHAAFLLLEAWLGGQVSCVNADSLTVPSASSTDGSGVAALLSQPRGAQEAPVPAQPLCCAGNPSSCSDPPTLLHLLHALRRAELCLANLQELEGQRSEAPWH